MSITSPNYPRVGCLALAAGLLAMSTAGCDSAPPGGKPPAQLAVSPPNEAAPPAVQKPRETFRKDDGAAAKRALLIGVTKYDNLGRDLRGPANDVALLRRTLCERYGFQAADIVSLTEDEGKPERRPTRANIEREFLELGEKARPGDQVVILLAGHGDRQPEPNPPTSRKPEPDGIDEIFLPADVQKWSGFPWRVPNAIVDDEIGAWLDRIIANKSYVWIIFDCCHAASMRRDDENARQLPPGLLVPSEALSEARERARKQQGFVAQADKPAAYVADAASEYLVATYACRADETTPEVLQPADSPDPRFHGLLTYHLVQFLEDSAASPSPMTYREMIQRIQKKYCGRPQGAPTPTMEGAGQHRVVLGVDKPIRPRITLTKKKGSLTINAGDVHGVRPDSILSVYTASGGVEAMKLVGYVRVERSRTFDADVTPVAYNDMPALADLPANGLCEIVSRGYSLPALRIGVDPDSAQPSALKAAVARALAELPERLRGLLEWVENPRDAAWLASLEDGQPVLREASGTRQATPLPPLDSDRFARELTQKLERVRQAHNLIAMATQLEIERARDGNPADFKIEVLRRRAATETPQVVERPKDGWVFVPGDKISFRVTNTSVKSLDVTLLIVDLDDRIVAYYPQANEIGKTLEPGKSFTTPEGEIDDKPPFGAEALIAIVAPPTKPPIDFTLLASPDRKDRGYGGKSPLGELLAQSAFARGTRGPTRSATEEGVRVLNWRTAPGARK